MKSKGMTLIELIVWVSLAFLVVVVVSVMCNESLSDLGRSLGIKSEVEYDCSETECGAIPGGVEVCDGMDNDCPGFEADENYTYELKILIDTSGSMCCANDP